MKKHFKIVVFKVLLGFIIYLNPLSVQSLLDFNIIIKPGRDLIGDLFCKGTRLCSPLPQKEIFWVHNGSPIAHMSGRPMLPNLSLHSIKQVPL